MARIFQFLALVVLVVGPGSLSAQSHAPRGGLWGGVGVGYGALRFDCSSCPPGETVGATAGQSQIGWTLNPRWLVGLTLSGWQREGSDDHGTELMAAIRWYPRGRGRAFVQSGLGRSSFRGAVFDGPREHGAGIGFMVGAGYDVAMGRSVSVTPLLALTHSRIGSTSLFGQVERSGVRYTVLVFGIGVTAH